MKQNLLTAEELGDHLRLSVKTVRQLARAGKIPYIRLSLKIVRYDLEAVTLALRDHASDKGVDRE